MQRTSRGSVAPMREPVHPIQREPVAPTVASVTTKPRLTTAEIVKRFKHAHKSRKGWSALCPAHPDSSASLSIGTGKDGRTLIHCFAGCTLDQITQKAGLRISDLFAEPLKTSTPAMKPAVKPVSLYDEVLGKL